MERDHSTPNPDEPNTVSRLVSRIRTRAIVVENFSIVSEEEKKKIRKDETYAEALLMGGGGEIAVEHFVELTKATDTYLRHAIVAVRRGLEDPDISPGRREELENALNRLRHTLHPLTQANGLS